MLGGLRSLGHAARAGSPALTGMAAAAALLLAGALALQMLDPRAVLGVSNWSKPAKFGASVALTAFTMALILAQLVPPGAESLSRGLRRASRIMTAMLGLELLLITTQAARGVPSHFNASTRLDALVFQVMGAGISVFWVAQVYVTWRAFRQRFATRPLMWGIRLGLMAAVVGGALGFLMPIPNAAQRARLRAGQPTPMLGAHAVGVPDGGPGLPVTRWSTTGGDLRVAHFIGMHGLQALPLLGWALARRRRRDTRPPMPARDGLPLVVFASAGYLGLVLATLAQALRARPLFSPDGVTVGLFLGSLALGAVLQTRVRVKPL